MDTIIKGVLTLSDRASSGIYEYKAPAYIERVLDSYIKNDIIYHKALIPDDYVLIVKKLLYLVEEKKCELIVTSGGKGTADREETPESTEAV